MFRAVNPLVRSWWRSPPLTDADYLSVTSFQGQRGAAWIWGLTRHFSFNTYLPPNSRRPDLAAHGIGWYAARSNHTGGVNAGLCDGSVRFVSDAIDLSAWRALSTRTAGEIIGDF
jgi:prepilin-type processing-associated H-X9-DG protein